uniref:Chaperone protein DnaK n=1 Tax=Mallomonas splendens TaxID=52552 RepID=A0A3G2QZR4_9STRA|nr:heat shock protein 70 [Mallomonas splendens]AYO28584.1 heat shock protein 70 [Mallomonas splendens]
MNTNKTYKKIVGIDLGTTNSVISVLEGANPKVISNSEGGRTTPSVVAYTQNGEVLVGQLAKRQSVVNPENTFYSVKRFIGCKYDEIESETKRISYKVKQGENGKIKIYSPILKKEFSPEEISASILKKLVTDASKYLKETVTEAIITVPAYFNDSQRLATKDAGTIAGLDVLRILNEPTAAALAYGLDKKKNEVVLIFDLGGGTFDVSILEVGDEVFEVLSTSGDTHLGGDDFDQLIVSYVIESFNKSEGIDLYKEKQALQRIIEASEKAKIELSSIQSTRINLPFIYIDGQTPKNIDLEFDRSRFENLSKDLLEKCKGPVLKALQDAKLNKSDIDQVILVGGSTRIPAVRNLLVDLLGKTLNETVNPDEVVAMGAAIQAGIIAGEITDLILLDVTPLSLGVETLGGLMTTIINRNSSIPIKQSELFSTGADFQDTVEIHVLQGERPFAKDNKSLGIFKLKGIPPAPRGIPKINVTFQLDVNGLLSVSAREEQSGQEQSIKIEGASVLGREEVSKMIKEAEENALLDKSKKSYVNITYELDNLILKCEVILEKIELKNTIAFQLFEIVLNEIKSSYKKKKLKKISTNSLNLLKEAYNFLLYAYILEQLSKSESPDSGNGTVIDVTDQ